MRPIPTMPPGVTNPMGKYWQQPAREAVLLDGQHALVRSADLAKLADCTGRAPDCPYAGKMWRALFRGVWWLMWYEQDVIYPEKLCIQWRQLLVVE